MAGRPLILPERWARPTGKVQNFLPELDEDELRGALTVTAALWHAHTLPWKGATVKLTAALVGRRDETVGPVMKLLADRGIVRKTRTPVGLGKQVTLKNGDVITVKPRLYHLDEEGRWLLRGITVPNLTLPVERIAELRPLKSWNSLWIEAVRHSRPELGPAGISKLLALPLTAVKSQVYRHPLTRTSTGARLTFRLPAGEAGEACAYYMMTTDPGADSTIYVGGTEVGTCGAAAESIFRAHFPNQ